MAWLNNGIGWTVKIRLLLSLLALLILWFLALTLSGVVENTGELWKMANWAARCFLINLKWSCRQEINVAIKPMTHKITATDCRKLVGITTVCFILISDYVLSEIFLAEQWKIRGFVLEIWNSSFVRLLLRTCKYLRFRILERVQSRYLDVCASESLKTHLLCLRCWANSTYMLALCSLKAQCAFFVHCRLNLTYSSKVALCG